MNLILYFVKYPQAGKVKTRLARSIGAETACRLYRELAEKNYGELTRLKSSGIDFWVLYDPPEKSKEIEDWLPDADGYVPQSGEGLGERLEAAFHAGFWAGYSSVAALGSDTLDFDHTIAFGAFQIQEKQDAVIGPAEDGGYYWIGMSRFVPELFHGISWSTPEVLEQTLNVARSQPLKYQLLEPLRDLDEIQGGSYEEITPRP